MWLRLKKLFVTCLNCSSVGFKWPRGQWLLRWAVCSSTPERFPSLAWAAAGALSSGPGAVDVPRTVDFVGMQPPRGAQGDGQPSRGAPSLSLGRLQHSCSGAGGAATLPCSCSPFGSESAIFCSFVTV